MLGNDNYTLMKAYFSILQLSCIGNRVKKVVPDLQSDEAESGRLFSNKQISSRSGQSAIDAAAVIVDRAYAAWITGQISGVLIMDFTAAFPSIATGRLVILKKVRQRDGDFI